MLHSKNRWVLREVPEDAACALAAELDLPPLAARVLAGRRFTSAAQARAALFLDEATVCDPQLFDQMAPAVERIRRAIAEGEKIRVYGDYDADGVTSTTVMLKALASLGARVDFAIPNRFDHGYGPNESLFRKAFDEGVTLLITVDNGISGLGPMAAAKEWGLDIILTDHHEPGPDLPDVPFLLHPRLNAEPYPCSDLAGVGVAFKLAHALLGEFPAHLLPYVAIGTVADLVPLSGENRYFVQRGIEIMRKTADPALRALAAVCGAELTQIDEETIGFGIGPRINAIGRLGGAEPAVSLFLSETAQEATSYAALLDEANRKRQKEVARIAEEAIEQVVAAYGQNVPRAIVVAGEGWNPGVVGIVASKLVERFYRPAVVLCIDPATGKAKGSARSIEGFQLYDALAANQELLSAFGGHPMAAGLTMLARDIPALKAALEERAASLLQEGDLIPSIAIDAAIEPEQVTVEAIRSLDRLRPFGSGFPKPVFLLPGVQLDAWKKIGSAQAHIKAEIRPASPEAPALDAVGFGLGPLADRLTPSVPLSLVGDVSINEWNGRRKPQFLVRDLAIERWQLFDIRGQRPASRWLGAVDDPEAVYYAFTEEGCERFRSLVPAGVCSGAATLSKARTLVLLDLPEALEQLEEVMKKCQPDNVYAHFHSDQSSYFTALPSREQFAWFYGLLRDRQALDLEGELAGLARHTGWTQQSFRFMARVFSELHFARLEGGLLRPLADPPKRSLDTAPAYRAVQQRMDLEQQLVYAPYAELNSLLAGLRR